jgi:hypothetical protein
MQRKELNTRDINMIRDALFRRHTHFLQSGEYFDIEGYKSQTEVYVKMTLRNEDDSLFYPVEARVDPRTIDHTPDEAESLLLDFVDYYFGRYLREDRDVYVPIDWHPIDFDDVTIDAKGQIYNKKLERMADKLMSEQGEPYDV